MKKERHPHNKYHDIDRARLAYANNANRRYCSGSDKNAELEEIDYFCTSEVAPKENRCVLKARERSVLCPEK